MKVILTAAIMDMFHNGHKNVLEKMQARGDKVVVVLHDDKSCYDIKGKIPVQTVEHRKRNLMLTGLADEVLITKSIDPWKEFKEVIDKYDDIIFMRGDDNIKFPGRWIIDDNEIPIEFIPYTQGESSTKKRNDSITRPSSSS